MLPFIPTDFLGFIPLYGVIPIPNFPIGIGQAFNIALVFIILYVVFTIRKQKIYYQNGLMKKYATYLLSGKTGKGKTRFIAQTLRDCKNEHTITVANFFNGYTDIFYSSFKDFCLLQVDIAILGEHSNFDTHEKNLIEKYFTNYFNESRNNPMVKKIKGKYDFITAGDEFYAYLHNRNFMGNFSKEFGKKLLLDLHQTRHSNQTLLLASQDSDNLDLDLRQLAHNEIEVKTWLLDLFYGFNIHKYLTKKEIQTYGIEFVKINIIPYFFFNYYACYNGLNKIYYVLQKLKINFQYLFKTYIYKRYYFETKIKTLKFWSDKALDYNTKFNVKTSIDIYNPGDLFLYLIEKEKKSKKIGQ